jgi:phospholipid/cholesterol/gamma-HCH transport system substrate-binding protein
MARQTRAFWVGTFVVAGILIGIVALIWLGTADWFAKKNSYVTYFAVSVQGLNIDSAVKFRGVDVGKVKALSIAPDGDLIQVTMDLVPTFKVKETMRVQLGFSGITGLKYVEVDYAEGENLIRHPSLSFEPPLPVIPSAPGGFEEINQSLREIYNKLQAIDTEGISWRAKTFFDQGTRMMASIDSLARSPELVLWAEKIGRTADRADSLISVLDTHRYNVEIDSTLVQLRTGSQEFHRLMDTLNEEAARLRMSEQADSLFAHTDGLVRSSQEFVERSQYGTLQSLERLNTTIDGMNAAITQLNSLLLSLEAYPSHIINALPPEKEK